MVKERKIMIFMCGVANLGKTEKEIMRIYIHEKERLQRHNEKREHLKLMLVELRKSLEENLAFNNEKHFAKQRERLLEKKSQVVDICVPYGSLFEEVHVTFQCYQDINDKIGDIELRFSKVFKGAEAIYVFPIDEFISATREEQKKLITKGIIESLRAIKAKKKGDFNDEKLIKDILSAISNL